MLTWCYLCLHSVTYAYIVLPIAQDILILLWSELSPSFHFYGAVEFCALGTFHLMKVTL